MQEIIIVAGPNGAGKTSFANEYLPMAQEGLSYVNADEIARSLAAEGLSGRSLELSAGREMLIQIDRLVESRREFMLETTLATLSYAVRIPVWRTKGYSISLI